MDKPHTTKGAAKPRPKKVTAPARPLPKPEPTAEPPRSRWPIVGFIVGFVVLGLCIVLARSQVLSGPEQAVFSFVNNWPDGLRIFFMMASIAPESLWIGMVSVIVTFLLKMYHLSWRLAASVLVGYGIVFGLKHWIGRPRPAELLDGIHARVSESGFGFPSGHAMIITVVLLTLYPYLPKTWRLLVLLLIPLMALSRLYLGVHAPLDVLGGVGIGLLVVAGIKILPKKVRSVLRLS